MDRAVGDAGVAVREHEPRDDHPPVPWHFKFLVGSLVIYLGYRAWQGIAWLQHHVH